MPDEELRFFVNQVGAVRQPFAAELSTLPSEKSMIRLFAPKQPASASFAPDRKIHISPTGRVWVDPGEVVRTKAFQEQVQAVKRLREAQERANAA